MGDVVIVGCDPGFASMGLALVRLSDARPLVVEVEVIQTAKANKKQNILSSEDNVERARKLVRLFSTWLVPAQLIGAESMSFARNAGAAHKVGIAWGVIVAVAEREHVPICQTSPQDVKLRVAGAKTASKGDVKLAVTRQCDFSMAAGAYLEDLALGQHEHAYDAIACALATVDGDLVRGLRRR